MNADVLAAWPLLTGRRVLALTGAGMSTDSGIPDYRGPDSPPRSPMTYQEFVSGESARRRYWARSHIGWRHLDQARPNAGHRAMAELEDRGVVTALITQNVDGLHQQAGSRTVVDLHGRIADVTCLTCRSWTSRTELHRRLDVLNRGFRTSVELEDLQIAPDGDAVLRSVEGFVVAACQSCGGVLKPDVVFFGESVPKPRVEQCYALVDEADVLLVCGSSLTVMSGLRFVRHAHRRDIPVVVVNRGPTRGDAMATAKIDAGCSEILGQLVALTTSGDVSAQVS